MKERLYTPPKKFVLNKTLEFLRNVESIFHLEGKKEREVYFLIAKIEEVDILGLLLIYKFIEYTATHACFENPRLVESEFIKNELKKYAFWNLIQDYKQIKEDVYKNLNFQDFGTFFITPMPLLRGKKYDRNLFLPQIETYYAGNDDAISVVLTCLGEIILNFWEHAVEDSQSILVASGNKHKIEIACADTGNGIISSLLPVVGNIKKKDDKKERERVLLKSLSKNVTSKSNTNHMGCGLWEINELVAMNKGRLHIYSEGAYVHNDFGQTKSGTCAFWKGTIIYVSLPLDNPKTLKNIQCNDNFSNIQINFQ